ncbi:MAG: hypothetical protein Kow00128_07270 [Deltaproteobacteria bacterium]
MKNRLRKYGILFAFLLPLPAFPAAAGEPVRLASVGMVDADHADLVVRKVTVTPIRARVGEPVRIEMEWVYWGALINTYYETTTAEVRANGRTIASTPFDYNYGFNLGETFRHTFVWDTRGMPPGEYRIRAEIPLVLDATPFDNYLDLKEPLILVSEGDRSSPEPGSARSAVAENPAWKNR